MIGEETGERQADNKEAISIWSIVIFIVCKMPTIALSYELVVRQSANRIDETDQMKYIDKIDQLTDNYFATWVQMGLVMQIGLRKWPIT